MSGFFFQLHSTVYNSGCNAQNLLKTIFIQLFRNIMNINTYYKKNLNLMYYKNQTKKQMAAEI